MSSFLDSDNGDPEPSIRDEAAHAAVGGVIGTFVGAAIGAIGGGGLTGGVGTVPGAFGGAFICCILGIGIGWAVGDYQEMKESGAFGHGDGGTSMASTATDISPDHVFSHGLDQLKQAGSRLLPQQQPTALA